MADTQQQSTKERMRALREALADERLERMLQAVDECLPAEKAEAVRALAREILDQVRSRSHICRAYAFTFCPHTFLTAFTPCRCTWFLKQQIELTPADFRGRVRELAADKMDALVRALSALKHHEIADSDVAREQHVQSLCKPQTPTEPASVEPAVKKQRLRIAEMRSMRSNSVPSRSQMQTIEQK